MNAEYPKEDANADASAYLLHILLQRLEVQHPGLVLSMLNGVKADQSAVITQGTATDHEKSVFDKAVNRLELCHAQNQMVSIESDSRSEL